MKFKVNKFALAAATSTTIFYFIKRVVFKMFLFRGMMGFKWGMTYGYGWRMMDAATRAKGAVPRTCHWGWYTLGIVIVFVSSFVAAWFFAWFYNKLVSKK